MSKFRRMNAVRRIACFLNSVGIRPALENMTNRERLRFLMTLYLALPPELRREARQRGRLVIRAIGLSSASASLLPPRAVVPQSSLARQDRAEQMAALLRESLGPCTTCASWGHPKRSWPTRELAEAFRPFAGDMSLQAYQCPAVSGTWHTGHVRKIRSEPRGDWSLYGRD